MADSDAGLEKCRCASRLPASLVDETKVWHQNRRAKVARERLVAAATANLGEEAAQQLLSRTKASKPRASKAVQSVKLESEDEGPSPRASTAGGDGADEGPSPSVSDPPFVAPAASSSGRRPSHPVPRTQSTASVIGPGPSVASGALPPPSHADRIQQLEWHVGSLQQYVYGLDQAIRNLLAGTKDDQSRSVVLCNTAQLVMDLARAQPPEEGEDDDVLERKAQRERRRASRCLALSLTLQSTTSSAPSTTFAPTSSNVATRPHLRRPSASIDRRKCFSPSTTRQPLTTRTRPAQRCGGRPSRSRTTRPDRRRCGRAKSSTIRFRRRPSTRTPRRPDPSVRTEARRGFLRSVPRRQTRRLRRDGRRVLQPLPFPPRPSAANLYPWCIPCVSARRRVAREGREFADLTLSLSTRRDHFSGVASCRSVTKPRSRCSRPRVATFADSCCCALCSTRRRLGALR